MPPESPPLWKKVFDAAEKVAAPRLEAAVRASFLEGAVKAGTLAVVLAGHPIEGGDGFPTIRVVRVGEEGRSCEP